MRVFLIISYACALYGSNSLDCVAIINGLMNAPTRAALDRAQNLLKNKDAPIRRALERNPQLIVDICRRGNHLREEQSVVGPPLIASGLTATTALGVLFFMRAIFPQDPWAAVSTEVLVTSSMMPWLWHKANTIHEKLNGYPQEQLLILQELLKYAPRRESPPPTPPELATHSGSSNDDQENKQGHNTPPTIRRERRRRHQQ